MAKDLEENIEKILEKIYYDPKGPGSFSGIQSLYRAVKKKGYKKISLKQITNFLHKQPVYSEYRYVKRKFPREKIIVPRKNYQISADIMSFKNLSKYNNGVKGALVAIENLSRYVHSYPLSDFTSKSVVQSLKKIFKKYKFTHFSSDKGSEFLANNTKEYLKSMNMKQFFSQNPDTKNSSVERAILEYRRRLAKIMDEKNTYKWVNYLPSVTSSINNTYNRRIRTTPSHAKFKLSDYELWERAYPPKIDKKLRRKSMTKEYKYNLGDNVKISLHRSAFSKSSDKSFSNEIFKIVERKSVGGVDKYILKDASNRILTGYFYDPELALFIPPKEDNRLYQIDKILSKKKVGKSWQYLVSWKGFDSSFNSYVDSNQIKNLE